MKASEENEEAEWVLGSPFVVVAVAGCANAIGAIAVASVVANIVVV